MSGILLKIRRRLAFRLTLWYAGVFALLSCVAFLLFYTLITTVVKEKADQDLSEQASQFSTVLRTEGMEGVQRLALLEAQAAGVRKVFIRLLYPNGQAFYSSNMAYWASIGVREEALAGILRGPGRVFDTVILPDRSDEVRILYAAIGPGVILQVGHSMMETRAFMRAFRANFALTMLVLVALAAGVGWFMARQAVRGIEEIRDTARKISAGALDRRVPVKGRGDEVDELAEAFNRMLDRIQGLLSELREMSDNIAHDLKSPVTRIRGMAEVSFTTTTSREEYEAMAAGIVEECDRLLDLINTMLMISRTESGVDRVVRDEVDLGALVSVACELFAPMAEDKGQRLICPAPGRCAIRGDKRMLQRMLSNLIDNAIKYTPPGGTVRVSVSEDGAGAATLTVADTGIGISEADLPRVFERFFRCDESRSQAGAGLGLSLAQAIARAHGGQIEARSAPSQGSTFTVTLPKALPLAGP